MTPAARYIAAQYETGVDAQLDLDAMRRFLLTRGLKRSPAQVVHELDNVFCFTGYAASHPAPALIDLDDIDRAIDRMTPQEIRRLPIPEVVEFIGTKALVATTKRSYNGRNSQPTTGTRP